ncbi:MAG: hypothetical protein CMF23_12110 [Ignavibacteriae bacterium]|nr:hypothetical protein [Ignavibacteriota bacterium]
MNKLIYMVIIILSTTGIFAQWEAVNNGLTNLEITSMFSAIDTMVVGSKNGIFKSLNDGDEWTNISGNIPNTEINDVRGGEDINVIWASTPTGAFFTLDQSNYLLASSGISNQNIGYYWLGEGEGSTNWLIGTKGGGMYSSPEILGPWTERNEGLSGDALIINDVAGYKEEVTYTIIGTDNGAYYTQDSLRTWLSLNAALSGDQLKVNKVLFLGNLILIATDAGLFASMDMGSSWLPFIVDEKINLVGIHFSESAVFYFAMGEKAYLSFDLLNWQPIPLTNVTGGNITSADLNSKYLFIGTETGGVYRIKVDQITNIEDDYLNNIPINFSLSQNYPNPFNPTTSIEYSVPSSEYVSLKVYDILGNEVAQLVNESKNAGKYEVKFDASNLTSGIYIYKIQAGSFNQVRKMMLIK